jgi:hypothetical protein
MIEILSFRPKWRMERLGKPRHGRGRPEAERTGVSESNLLAEADQTTIRDVSTSLDMTDA